MGSSQSSDKVGSDSNSNDADTASRRFTAHPKSTRQIYDDAIDKITAELPYFVEEENRLEMEEYKQLCDDGKGPMVRIVWRPPPRSCC